MFRDIFKPKTEGRTAEEWEEYFILAEAIRQSRNATDRRRKRTPVTGISISHRYRRK